MSDTYGDLIVPAQLPDTNGSGAGLPVDRVLDCFGDFLKAVLIANVGDMWQAVAPALAPVVRRVFTADPEDVLLNESHLPALFIWDGESSNHQQFADDWWTTDRTIVVMWLFDPGDRIKRESRMRAQDAITSTIHHELSIGRNPVWVDPTDPDAQALRRGSVLTTRCGLITLPKPQRSARVLVSITRENSEVVTYRAFRTPVLVTQRYRRDPAAHGTPAALSLSVQSGGTTVDSKFDPS